jgi:hypothetical protein
MGHDCTTQACVNARAHVHRCTRVIIVNCPFYPSIERIREKLSFPSTGSKVSWTSGEFSDPSDVPHRSDSSWEVTSRCIDQVWNSLNALLGKQIDRSFSQENLSIRLLQCVRRPTLSSLQPRSIHSAIESTNRLSSKIKRQPSTHAEHSKLNWSGFNRSMNYSSKSYLPCSHMD